jgi:hypothetical protein
MGFFKSMNELSRMGREMEKNRDVAGDMASGMARMAAAQEMMAAQTQAANLAVTGLDGVATISAVRQSGGMVNFAPICEIDLTVMAAGRPPIPVTVTQPVEQIHLAKAMPGSQVAVKVDPNDASTVWINWIGAVPTA